MRIFTLYTPYARKRKDSIVAIGLAPSSSEAHTDLTSQRLRLAVVLKSVLSAATANTDWIPLVDFRRILQMHG